MLPRKQTGSGMPSSDRRDPLLQIRQTPVWHTKIAAVSVEGSWHIRWPSCQTHYRFQPLAKRHTIGLTSWPRWPHGQYHWPDMCQTALEWDRREMLSSTDIICNRMCRSQHYNDSKYVDNKLPENTTNGMDISVTKMRLKNGSKSITISGIQRNIIVSFH